MKKGEWALPCYKKNEQKKKVPGAPAVAARPTRRCSKIDTRCVHASSGESRQEREPTHGDPTIDCESAGDGESPSHLVHPRLEEPRLTAAGLVMAEPLDRPGWWSGWPTVSRCVLCTCVVVAGRVHDEA